MKHSLSIVIVLVAFITLYAFSNQKRGESGNRQVTVVLVYNSGNQSSVTSYTQTSTVPPCPGAVRLCAIRTTDPNGDGVISQSEFTPIFNALDTNSNHNLDDQTETTVLLKKA